MGLVKGYRQADLLHSHPSILVFLPFCAIKYCWNVLFLAIYKAVALVLLRNDAAHSNRASVTNRNRHKAGAAYLK